METIILGLLIVGVVGGAVTLIVLGLRDSHRQDPLQDRLAEFAASGETAFLEEIELSQPLFERVIQPISRRFGEFALKFTPQNALQTTARKLELAGNPKDWNQLLFGPYDLSCQLCLVG